jgi:hypothetical protein
MTERVWVALALYFGLLTLVALAFLYPLARRRHHSRRFGSGEGKEGDSRVISDSRTSPASEVSIGSSLKQQRGGREADIENTSDGTGQSFGNGVPGADPQSEKKVGPAHSLEKSFPQAGGTDAVRVYAAQYEPTWKVPDWMDGGL